MDLESWSPAARGLRDHVRLVAAELGCSGEAFWVQTEAPVSAYLPLEQRLHGFPDRDAALLWDPTHGWSAAIEAGTRDEPLVVTYLGGDVLPEPAAVASFVADLVAGRPTGEIAPPVFDTDGLADRLAEHAPILRPAV